MQIRRDRGRPTAARPRSGDRLVTAGGRPVRIVFAAAPDVVVDVPAVPVVDTIGSGDAFGAGFLAAWTGAGRCRAELRGVTPGW